MKNFDINLILNEHKKDLVESRKLFESVTGSNADEFESSLYDYYYLNKTTYEAFNTIENIGIVFEESQLFNKLELKDGSTLWTFDPTIYDHLESSLFGCKTRIEIIKKEEKVTDSELIDDLKKLLISDYKIIDIEFFEYADVDNQFDFSKKIKEIFEENKDFREIKRLLKENNLNIEKEKIHLKILKGRKGGQIIHLPLYTGIGTNQPLTISSKSDGHKKRWHKLSLDSVPQYIEQGGFKDIKKSYTDFETFVKTFNNSEYLESINWNSPEKSNIVTFIDKEVSNLSAENNDLIIGYAKYKQAGESMQYVCQVEPEYKKNPINRLSYWRCFIKKGNDYQTYLSKLIEKCQKEYEIFFEIENSPYKFLSKLGSKKILTYIERTHKKVLSGSELEELRNCVAWGNLMVIVGDLEKLGINSDRNKISTLLVSLLILSNEFEVMIK